MDQQQIAKLYREYYAAGVQRARKWFEHRRAGAVQEDAEEAVQDAFIIVFWQKTWEYDSFRRLFFGVLRGVLLNTMKKPLTLVHGKNKKTTVFYPTQILGIGLRDVNFKEKK